MNKLEDIFKKSLGNAEAPYDAKAWDAMSSRLDKAMPISAVKGSFKWAWVAGVVLIAGTSAIVLFNQESKTIETKTSQISKIENELVENTKSNEINISERSDNLSSSNELANKDVSEIPQKTNSKSNITTEKPETSDVFKGIYGTKNEVVELQTPKVTSPEIVKPKIEQKIVSLKDEHVKEIISSKIDFTASNETFYEKGLPFNSLTCSIDAKKYTWTNERGEILSTDKNADIHLFTAGTSQITLTVEHFNGEKQSITKAVRCEVNYNLLAVTGFNPTSSDYRNNTFIPFALLKTERNIPFDMQIIDPQTGQVVFETKNVDIPWDGIDMRTNQMVPVNSTYIWRVKIYQKAAGEPSSRYQGTITRI